MFEDIYMDIKISLKTYGEGPEFSKLIKFLHNENGIPIGRHHKNIVFYTLAYEVEHIYGHKASLSANNVSENLSSQVDEESSIIVLFYEIVDHYVDGIDTMQ